MEEASGEEEDVGAEPAPTGDELDPSVLPSQDPEEAADIQEQAERHEAREPQMFGTFAGVFTPTLLTILGVIMFLREGWVVGNAGLGGAFLVILISFAITTATGLSMSSFVTNIRIGPGGAFSMISQSLGLEAGGAIGGPLYLAQALAVVLYVFGFREGYLWAVAAWDLPDLPPLAIDLMVFAIIFGISAISTALAFRVQYVILAVIGAALISIGIAAGLGSMREPIVWWGDFRGSPEHGFSGTTFWAVFAVYFPASTGIMAGANMSGELKDPRRSIPRGMMSAIGVSLVVYLLLAYWLIRTATIDELTSDYTIAIDRAFWGPAVLAGLLAATFSSALASFVGAPRILQAMATHRIAPFSESLSKRTSRGEPRNATFLTAVIVLAAIMLRELNALAPLLTMIFLLTYATINFVVLVEQSLRLISFRPLLRIPRAVSFGGLLGCLVAMFIINPIFSLVALALVAGSYFFLMHRQLIAPTGDVRSGLFAAAAEWAAKRVKLMESTSVRAWRPNILIPVEDPDRLRGSFELVRQMADPVGSVKLLGLAPPDELDELQQRLVDTQQALMDAGVFASSAVMESHEFHTDVRVGMQALAGSFFRPNLLLLELAEDQAMEESLHEVLREAARQRMGVALLVQHPVAGLGRRRRVNLWIPDLGPEWKIEMEFEQLDLAILLAYRMRTSWGASLRAIVTIQDESEGEAAEKFLERLVELARLPADTEVHIETGDASAYETPGADLNVLPLPAEWDAAELRRIRDATGATCLFTQDSGAESALV